jgi:hypothetical protein
LPNYVVVFGLSNNTQIDEVIILWLIQVQNYVEWEIQLSNIANLTNYFFGGANKIFLL